MTLKNNRAPLLSNIKLYASFHHHMWIQTGVTVRKRLSWVVTSVTLTFDLWPWPFAWTLRWSLVITPENFKMIRWWEHSQKGVTDRRTDGQTDRRTENTICRAAWSQLKNVKRHHTRVTGMSDILKTGDAPSFNSPSALPQNPENRNNQPVKMFSPCLYNSQVKHLKTYLSNFKFSNDLESPWKLTVPLHRCSRGTVNFQDDPTIPGV